MELFIVTWSYNINTHALGNPNTAQHPNWSDIQKVQVSSMVTLFCK